MSVFAPEDLHAMEFKADAFAFESVLRCLNSRQPNYSARRAFDPSVTLFFNFVREIGNRGSETHPRPSDRMLAVARSFFGGDAASILERSFDDLKQVEIFKKEIGDLTVGELLKCRDRPSN